MGEIYLLRFSDERFDREASSVAIRMASGAGIPGLDPEQMKQLTESGTNMTVIIIAAGGGALVAAIKPD